MLGLLAIKPEHQHAIADRGALQVLSKQSSLVMQRLAQAYLTCRQGSIFFILRLYPIASEAFLATASASVRSTLHTGANNAVVQGLVGLLKQHVPSRCPPGPGASVARRAADAITNLAHENVTIKCKVRAEGGVPPLVALLESFDAKVGLE